MRGFHGFPPKGRLVKIPGLFFSELLTQIDHLPELKVTLYCFWRLQSGDVLFLRKGDIRTDAAFMVGLGAREEQRIAALEEGLERAVARGTLLHVCAEEDGHQEDYYFVNTEKGRTTVEQIERGEWFPDGGDPSQMRFAVERPNIFTLYEQNIGPLTPLISENLAELEKEYSELWIRDALEIAVVNNARKLSYIEAILKRWRDQGRPKQNDAFKKTGDWYISGKYGDEVEH